ncbi:hypothetical protein [uncultured Capnocytophaga sp.]|uniref:hypothetical protein n=1 Tax=uncultured Capnocytophaga sp. TaxID=159273 RepID=UPI0026334FF4|nr:hypothetical protein [uncultured Capnocytophaga sp.]
MKLFFTLVSMFLCLGTLHAQKAQKVTVERFIEALRNTSEEDFPILYPMLKITQVIPAEQGGMEKIRQVFTVIKSQIQEQGPILYTSQEAIDLINSGQTKQRVSDILTSDRGVVIYIYLPYNDKLLVRFPIVVDKENEIIAINIDYCKDNTICLQYL